jgi:hypothetical protein
MQEDLSGSYELSQGNFTIKGVRYELSERKHVKAGSTKYYLGQFDSQGNYRFISNLYLHGVDKFDREYYKGVMDRENQGKYLIWIQLDKLPKYIKLLKYDPDYRKPDYRIRKRRESAAYAPRKRGVL